MAGGIVAEGWAFAAVPALAALTLAATGHRRLALVPATAAGACLWFFRDPHRCTPTEDGTCVAAADGRVVAVRALDGGRTRVSTFLSLLDVHVNRSPVAGTVAAVRHQPGRFVVASREEASQVNEQNAVTITTADGTVVVRQVAGMVARRIVCWKRPGDHLVAGERFGLIRFGSRVDVELGPEWSVCVGERERLRAGTSVLAVRLGEPW